MDSERLLLRPEEAAHALGISRSKIYELIAAGELGSVNIGRARRIPKTELDRWIADKMLGAIEPTVSDQFSA